MGVSDLFVTVDLYDQTNKNMVRSQYNYAFARTFICSPCTMYEEFRVADIMASALYIVHMLYLHYTHCLHSLQMDKHYIELQ